MWQMLLAAARPSFYVIPARASVQPKVAFPLMTFALTVAEDPSCFIEGRDLSGDDLLPQMRPYCPLETMDSEDLLFILYTSGSTGKPKVGVWPRSRGAFRAFRS